MIIRDYYDTLRVQVWTMIGYLTLMIGNDYDTLRVQV
jgi:hypothetical protein